jgi:hypothetical protein
MIVYDVVSSQWCNGINPDIAELAEAKTLLQEMIEAHGAKLREKITFPTSPVEMASWPIKFAEATKYSVTKDPADAPILSIEASTRGVSLDSLAQRVFNNSQQLTVVEAMIAGIVGRHKDAVSQLPDIDTVFSYDWSIGWPLTL